MFTLFSNTIFGKLFPGGNTSGSPVPPEGSDLIDAETGLGVIDAETGLAVEDDTP